MKQTSEQGSEKASSPAGEKLPSKEEFRAQMKQQYNIEAKPSAAGVQATSVRPSRDSMAEDKPGPMPVPTASTGGLSSAEIDGLIAKKKRGLFKRRKNPEDYTLDELEVLKRQALDEEKAQAEKAWEKAELARLRQEKKQLYDSYRQQYQGGTVDKRTVDLFFHIGALIRNVRDMPEKSAMAIKALAELYGLEIRDARHVFTDKEFDAYHIRVRETIPIAPYDTFEDVFKAQLRIPSGMHHGSRYPFLTEQKRMPDGSYLPEDEQAKLDQAENEQILRDTKQYERRLALLKQVAGE